MPARVDQVTEPQVVADLATARLGTAFFRRALNRLFDVDLDGASLLPGWTRRHVVAHVGYNARAIARLVDWAATGVKTPMYESTHARKDEIDFGATLPPEALRNLVEHSAIDLDVRWRDLPSDRWAERVTTAQGREVPASETVWMRTREVWLHAVDLDSGARVDQIPAVVCERLIGDVHRAWSARSNGPSPTLVATDSRSRWGSSSTESTVTGPLAALTSWATGRLPAATAADLLRWSDGRPGPAPHWI
jgi:maleylpyruvate isomerase